MNDRRSHSDLQELLGAYALDAVDPDEAAEVDDHLRECPRCRAEVAEHRETAALLVEARIEPPPALWDRLAATLDVAPPPLDLGRYAARRESRRARFSKQLMAAAAAVAILVGFGAVAYQQRQEVSDLRTALDDQELAVSALAAFDEPQARQTLLRAGDGSLELRAVVLPDGVGYLLAERLPDLPSGRTYQLWAIVDGEPISAGVLGPRPDVVTFDVADDISALAISEERAGGADEPTLPARLTGLVDA